MSWWRQNWRWLLAVIAGGLAIIVLLVLWIMRRGAEAAKLRAQLVMMQGRMKVAGLEADKKARTVELEANEVAAKSLDKQIIEAKRKTVSAVEAVEDMSDAEVVKAFKDLGY